MAGRILQFAIFAVLLLASAGQAREVQQAYEEEFVLKLDLGMQIAAGFSPDGSMIAVAHTENGNGAVTLWDASSGDKIRTLGGRTPGPITDFLFSPDGAHLLISSKDGPEEVVFVWDAVSGTEVRKHPIERKYRFAAFSPDGQRLAMVGPVKVIRYPLRIWDMESGKETFATTAKSPARVVFSSDGRTVLAAGQAYKRLASQYHGAVAQVWDTNTGNELLEIWPHGRAVDSVQFSPDGTRFVTSIVDRNTASVWDTRNGRELLVLHGHTARVIDATFSPDGSRIVTAGRDSTLRVWNALDGTLLATLPRSIPSDAAFRHALKFSPDSTKILSAGSDGVVRVWVDAQVKRQMATATFEKESAKAASGDVAAMGLIAMSYSLGRGVVKDVRQAEYWYRRAADTGDTEATVRQGAMLADGTGASQNCAEAAGLLRPLTSSGGDAEAVSLMNQMLAPLGGASGAAGMAPQIQADLLEAQIIDALARLDYPAFLENLCAFEALGHIERLPLGSRAELLYHRALGLRAAGKPIAALEALNRYLSTAGNTGASYQEAIRLLRPLQEEAK